MVWDIIAGTALSALGGVLGSNSAANAQEQAAKAGIKEQQRGLGIQLGLNEPNRYLGYNAVQDINREFGYGGTPYASASQLNQPTLDASAIIAALHRGVPLDQIGQLGRLGTLNSQEIAKLTGAGLNAQQIQQLAALPGSAGSGGGGAGGAGGYGGTGFTASPDYAFRRSQGMADLGNSFAARGGAFSGNALRALTDFNSGLASSEYGNWFQRRAQLAGLGGQATQNAQQGVQNATNNITGLQQAQGDARASGILGGYNSAANSINSGLQAYLMQQGGYFNRPSAGVPKSPYGPYAGGYQFDPTQQY